VFVGGTRKPTLPLHAHATQTALALMTLSVIAIALPALFYYSSLSPVVLQTQPNPLSPDEAAARLHALTLWTAAIMLFVYAAGLLYSFVTHKHLFHQAEGAGGAAWSSRRALGVMVVATLGIAGMAEALVGSVEGLTHSLGLTELFVGVVIVAIVGNAAEHSTAIIVAARGKMDLAFQIAAGSSTQIALLVTPVLIFVSFAIARPMDLVFELFELFGVAIAVVISYAVTLDRETNWFEGTLLLGVYVVICAVFFVHP
jgi:Ca2+:H+ antiporter